MTMLSLDKKATSWILRKLSQIMDEYMGCTIKKLETGGIKFPQKVLLQSYRDKFDIGSM
jgi:hypothetical protein